MLTATVTPDGQHVHIQGRHWSETIPATQLAQRIAFYESLRDRKDGVFAHIYAPTVKALRGAQKVHFILTKPKETAR